MVQCDIWVVYISWQRLIWTSCDVSSHATTGRWTSRGYVGARQMGWPANKQENAFNASTMAVYLTHTPLPRSSGRSTDDRPISTGLKEVRPVCDLWLGELKHVRCRPVACMHACSQLYNQTVSCFTMTWANWVDLLLHITLRRLQGRIVLYELIEILIHNYVSDKITLYISLMLHAVKLTLISLLTNTHNNEGYLYLITNR